MQGNTSPQRGPSRLAVVLAAAGTCGVVLVLVGTLLWAFLAGGGVDTFAVGIMVLYALAGAAVMAGVVAAMVQRLREIKKGEEEDARRY